MAVAISTSSRSSAAALEFWDGRLAIHGFYGMQVRSIIESYQWQNNSWDLTQWYHVLNLEIEADIAPEGFGPFANGPLVVAVDTSADRGAVGSLREAIAADAGIDVVSVTISHTRSAAVAFAVAEGEG